MPATMPEASHPASLWLPPMPFIYGSCMLLFLLDIHLLPQIFVGYGAIESEYRPLEQATRLAYLLVAMVAWLDLRLGDSNGENRSRSVGWLLLSLGLVMVLLENNWDLTLRETLLGRLVFAALLGAVLVWLSWLTLYWGWRMPTLYCLMVVLLALGQAADTFHDGLGGRLLENPAVHAVGTFPGFEETSELLVAWVFFHAAWLWHCRQSATIRFWRTTVGARLVVGLLLLGVGNGFLAFTREGRGGHFISNEMAILGFLLLVMGVCVLWRQLKEPVMLYDLDVDI